MINVCEVDDFWPVTVKHHAICRRQSNAFLRYTAYAKKWDSKVVSFDLSFDIIWSASYFFTF